MNLLIALRDTIDKVFNPLVAVLIRNRKILRLILAVIIIISLASLFLPSFHRQLGKLAWLLLLVILFLSPVSKIAQSKALASLMTFRREMGIFMGVLAIEHVLLYFIKFQIRFGSIFSPEFWIENGTISYRAFGLAALILILPLLATSNNFSMRVLKTGWKKLHRIVYVALIAVAIHVLILKQEYFEIVAILSVYGILKLLVATKVKILIIISHQKRLKKLLRILLVTLFISITMFY